MPKQVDYPRASLKNCLVLAEAVNDLGGECSAALAGDKLNKQHTSGAFKGLVGAAVKYSLVTNKAGQLKVTQLFRDIALAYDEEEGNQARKKAFLAPPLFKAIYDRFQSKTLPVAHFEKLLIREFGVPDQVASRVEGYFFEGAKQCGLLAEGNVLSGANPSTADEVIENGKNGDESEHSTPSENPAALTSTPLTSPAAQATHNQAMLDHHRHSETELDSKFTVRIKGPGMDSLIVINEEEDLLIVKAMLKKVEKRLAVEDEWGDD
ncbi:hypothetical protein [Pseudomonas sp. CFBP 8772]|uniref:hypothetical protein n=1 Tax=Pseudomonas sp. CFBP 8772 TaxID=2775284 RepID=UPI0017858D0E|nr:hypothetical protein [Pseudomonas sp. CFBP 8772]MBD8599404.1 hypothetical protein [Pseudomonas sp. CFBP 8772]